MSLEQELAAPCGVYCGACTMYRAASEPDLAEKLSKAMNRPVEEIACKGCRARAASGESLGCDTLTCITGKGLEFCYQCSDFPCSKFIPCVDRAAETPHNMKMYNLAVIEKRGVKALADEARDVWRMYFRGKKTPGQGEPQV